jgi:hypothetical protein
VSAYQRGGTDTRSATCSTRSSRDRARRSTDAARELALSDEYVKEFHDYLASYPKGTLAGAEDVLYWTKDTFGPKPVESAYHQTLYREPRAS